MVVESKGVFHKRFKITDYSPLSAPVFDLSSVDPVNENILQIDGGGIKGVLPAYWLYVMELSAERPVCNFFKTLWGTSTGAIIAALASGGMPMKEIVLFYIELGPEVFLRKSPFGIFGTKFDSKNLERKLKGFFSDDITFESLFARTNVELNITLVDARLRRTLVANYKRSPKMPVWKALMASTSAPYYFGPFSDTGRYFDEQEKEDNTYFDGGTGVFNNASEKAFNQAFYIKKIPIEKIFMLSLGTGKDVFHWTPKDFRNMPGLLQAIWAFEFAREESVREQLDELGYLQNDLGLQFFRYDIETPRELNPMDDTNNIPGLLSLVDKK